MEEISKNKIEHIIDLSKKEGLTFAENTRYFGIKKDDVIVGIGGLLEYKNNTVI